MAKRSPTGTGLRVVLGAVINPLPEFEDECPVNPSLCTQGLTVSVFIKVMESKESQESHPPHWHLGHRDYKFLFGNIDKHSLNIMNYNGFTVGVKGDTFQITVNSQKYICSSNQVGIRRYLWSHLVFTWKDPELPGGGLVIFVDSNRVLSKHINCALFTLSRMPLRRHLKIGSNESDLSITAELDHLAIWYQHFQASNSILTAPWVHVRGKLYSYFILVDWNCDFSLAHAQKV